MSTTLRNQKPTLRRTSSLLFTTTLHSNFYDAESMINMDLEEVYKLMNLLKSGKSKKRKSIYSNIASRLNDVDFMGTIVDACFGVNGQEHPDTTTNSRKSNRRSTQCESSLYTLKRDAETVRDMLDDCNANEAFRQTAITAYLCGLKMIVQHRKKMDKLNAISRKLRAKKIERDTEEMLRLVFSPLVMSVGEPQ